jgi:L-lactate dehydrogenase (cytochrome)
MVKTKAGLSKSVIAPFRTNGQLCPYVARGTHVLKALSQGAKACSGGRRYLYALAAAGQAGVERALGNLRAEIERDMKLMGCQAVDQLSRDNLRFR